EFGAKTEIWGYASHPLLDGQKLICIAGGEGTGVVAFDKDSGKEIWRSLSTSHVGYCPPTMVEAGGKRQLIAWFGDSVNGLDSETGKAYWSEPFATHMYMAISTPRKSGDYLFLTSTFNHSMALKLKSNEPAAEVAWKGDAKKNSFDSVFA